MGTGATEGDDSAHSYDRRVLSRFASLTTGFWRRGGSPYAWLFTLGLAGCLVANVSVQLAVNSWNGWFFNTLEKRDVDEVQFAVLVFAGLAVLVAAVGVGIVFTRESLQVRWREWVTRHLIGLWFAKAGYKRLADEGIEPANPEYRIADDVRMAIEPIVDFAIGLLSAVLGAMTFLGVLWAVGGSLQLGGVFIPAYMVLAALVYGFCASLLMIRVGTPLVRKVGARNEAEAMLRFDLTRARTDAQEIVASGSGARREGDIHVTYDRVVRRWLAVVVQNAKLTWITNGSGALIPVVPLVLAAPKYLQDELTLGAVVQLAAAFVQVQIAVSWIVDNYRRIAECYASVRRVVELSDAIEQLDPAAGKATGPTPAETLASRPADDLADAVIAPPALVLASTTTGE